VLHCIGSEERPIKKESLTRDGKEVRPGKRRSRSVKEVVKFAVGWKSTQSPFSSLTTKRRGKKGRPKGKSFDDAEGRLLALRKRGKGAKKVVRSTTLDGGSKEEGKRRSGSSWGKSEHAPAWPDKDPGEDDVVRETIGCGKKKGTK